MKVVKRKISELVPADYNPRRLTEKQEKHLTESLTEFGLVDPVIVNMNSDRKNIIIGGHQRLKVWQKLGNKEIDCVELDLSIEKEKELNIRLNANTGEWDIDLLLGEWEQFELESWGLTLEWPEEPIENEEDDFDVELPEEAKTVLGDLYEIGEHRLLCGDSTQTDTFEKIMQGELADMVLTDPPYNVNYEGGTKDKLKIKNDSMSNDDFYSFLYDFYTAQSTVLKKGGVVYIWHASSEIINFAKAFVDAGFLLKQQLIWLKNQLVMGRQDYQWRHEPCLEGVNAETWEEVKEHDPCLYGWKEGAGHFWRGGRKQSTILEFNKPLRNGDHPTMKPVGLFGLQIGNSTRVNEVVIDAFGGSGTTMVASHQLRRRCYTLEFDPKYCDVIINRMIKLDPTLRIKRNGVDITNEWN